ncbi:MAG: cytochrome b [Labrys sp. (in: a-proteobacteria)]|jgi:cytochrome b561
MTDRERWPAGLRLVHGVAALVVLTTLGIGLWMTHLLADAGQRFSWTQTHKSLGVLALALFVLRLPIRWTAIAPAGLGDAIRDKAAAVAHLLLYGLLLAVPLSGWAMASTSPLPVPTRVFGLFTLPPIAAPDFALYQTFHALHQSLAWALGALVLVHVAGALTHGARTGMVLRRMWSLRG